VGTVGAAATASIDGPYLNGFYRCSVFHTAAVDSVPFEIGPADADGDNTFLGDGVTLNTYQWGAQLEQTTRLRPSSLIYTAAATRTRDKDVFNFTTSEGQAGSDLGNGSARIQFMTQNYDNPASMALWKWGNSSTSFIEGKLNADDTANMRVETAGVTEVNIHSASDVCDGEIHTVHYRWAQLVLARFWVDNTLADSDTSVPTPTGMSNLYIGNNHQGNIHPFGLIANVRFFNKPYSPV
jgi:hypothetical protein